MINHFDYELMRIRENAGFFKIDRFDITGEENFIVRFGDETDDAHINATIIQLERIDSSLNSNEFLLLTLEKTE